MRRVVDVSGNGGRESTSVCEGVSYKTSHLFLGTSDGDGALDNGQQTSSEFKKDVEKSLNAKGVSNSIPHAERTRSSGESFPPLEIERFSDSTREDTR